MEEQLENEEQLEKEVPEKEEIETKSPLRKTLRSRLIESPAKRTKVVDIPTKRTRALDSPTKWTTIMDSPAKRTRGAENPKKDSPKSENQLTPKSKKVMPVSVRSKITESGYSVCVSGRAVKGRSKASSIDIYDFHSDSESPLVLRQRKTTVPTVAVKRCISMHTVQPMTEAPPSGDSDVTDDTVAYLSHKIPTRGCTDRRRSMPARLIEEMGDVIEIGSTPVRSRIDILKAEALPASPRRSRRLSDTQEIQETGGSPQPDGSSPRRRLSMTHATQETTKGRRTSTRVRRMSQQFVNVAIKSPSGN